MTAQAHFVGELRATDLSRPFWEHLRRGELTFQRCRGCDRRQHYPRVLCRFCGSSELEWARAASIGVVVGAVLAHRTSRTEIKSWLPYALAIVRMQDGPLLLATTSPASDQVGVGATVELDFAESLRNGVFVVAARPYPDTEEHAP